LIAFDVISGENILFLMKCQMKKTLTGILIYQWKWAEMLSRTEWCQWCQTMREKLHIIYIMGEIGQYFNHFIDSQTLPLMALFDN